MNKTKILKCKNCENEFKTYINRPKQFCSKICYDDYRHKEIKCKSCNKIFIVGKKSKRIYCSNQCAADDLKELRAMKIKETFNKKYGVNSPAQLQSVKDKIIEHRNNGAYDNMIEKGKETRLLKYGDKNYNNLDKNKTTKLERYGDENYNNRKKWLDTLKSRYGKGIHPNTEAKLMKSLEENKIGFKSDKFKEYLKDNNVLNVSQILSVKEAILKKRRIADFNNLYKKPNKFLRTIPLFNVNDYISQDKNELYKFQCLKCKKIFEDHIHQNHIPSCPDCYNIKYGTSMVEDEIASFIKEILPNYKILTNVRDILDGKELDIYIPNKNIAIEINGLYWHSELSGKKSKTYHLEKTNICHNLGIDLIHIFDVEWALKKEIVMSRLKAILGVNINIDRVYARNCEIKEISPTEKNKFLINFHLQGEDKSKYKLGLFHKNKLVSVMTFGRPRIALGNKKDKSNSYELSRFVSDSNVAVVGGASKLLSYFIKNYNPTKIISYADRRWSKGNLYEKLGFKKVSDGTPNYWYTAPKRYGAPLKHRFNFRKNVLKSKLSVFDENLTEWQNMQLNGYDRVWDCGSLKYEMILK